MAQEPIHLNRTSRPATANNGTDPMTSTEIPTDDPDTWPDHLDAVTAAPRHHQVLWEDGRIRVLSVSVAPGETEPVHHHRWPSIFVIDRLVNLRDRDGAGRDIPLPLPATFEPPLTLRLPPQRLHYVQNLDTQPFHGIRIEFKCGWPTTP